MTIPKPTLSFKNLLIIILLGVIVIMYFKQCGKPAPSNSLAAEREKKKFIDSSQKAFINYKDSATKVIAQRDDRADSILGEATVFEYERNQAWRVIKDKDNMINSLAAKVLGENGSNDSDCVDLARKSQSQSKQIEYQEGITVKLLDDLHLLSRTKDSVISDERRIKDAALKQGLLTATAYSELFAKYKGLQPKASVWIGPEMQLSPAYQTVGGHIMYATKRGTGWLLGAGITTEANYYVKAALLFKISLRKR